MFTESILIEYKNKYRLAVRRINKINWNKKEKENQWDFFSLKSLFESSSTSLFMRIIIILLYRALNDKLNQIFQTKFRIFRYQWWCISKLQYEGNYVKKTQIKTKRAFHSAAIHRTRRNPIIDWTRNTLTFSC